MRPTNWSDFGLAIFGVGITTVFLAVVFVIANPQNFVWGILLMFLAGAAITGLGTWILVWNWKREKRETHGKADPNLNYVFTLITENGTEAVTEYAQIEKALHTLNETKQGMVEVKIEPPMARICSVDCCYKNGLFYTHYSQERADGKGYWYSRCDTTHEANYNLKRMFLKHKKMDYYGLNRIETGEGRAI